MEFDRTSGSAASAIANHTMGAVSTLLTLAMSANSICLAQTDERRRASASQPRRWAFESVQRDRFIAHGKPKSATGVTGKCLVLDGKTLLMADARPRPIAKLKNFTFVIWVNPYDIQRGQQMIAAKNRYASNQREWGVMVDRDKHFRLYLWQGKWITIGAPLLPKPGHWHLVCVVVRPGSAELWINARRAGSVKLKNPIRHTKAPLTFGGVNDKGRIRQTLLGALDEAQLVPRPMSGREISSLYTPVSTTHAIPESARLYAIWDATKPLPKADDIPILKDVSFHVIKKWDKRADGYTFLHGVGLAWHKGKLYASFAHNKGPENTASEEAQYRVSSDGGHSWGPIRVIDTGKENDLAVSHGVFVSHRGKLWAFHGAYYGRMNRVHTRAYTLNETTRRWRRRGTVVAHGFWPMNQPIKMANGNWIMPGISAGPYSNRRAFFAAVAVSRGGNFTKWDYVKIPAANKIKRMWGESSLFANGKRIVNIARYGGENSPLVAISQDFGRTWTPSTVGNMPMATSKPAAGILSTGQIFLICTTAKGNGAKRTPLTIAVSRPGEDQFCKVFVIRRSLHPGHSGESATALALSYPCAIEHQGNIYVGYSNNGGRRGNQNSAELAVIPITSLK